MENRTPVAICSDSYFFEKDKSNSILVMGVGNYLMGDEGIGVHIIQEMSKIQFPGYVDILDGGTGGFLLLNCFEAYKTIIFIDATMDGKPAGTISLIRPKFASDFPSALSVHDVGLKDMIEAVYLMEVVPDIHLFTVSIEEINPMTIELNDKVQLVAGFHEGMTAMFGTEPETADNMELGFRYADGTTGVEAFYFESDYQSLKAACTNSQGGSCDEGDVFDGGAVDVSGIELSASMVVAGLNGVSYPLGVTYTSTDATFGNSFDDDGEYWGVVAAGDDVPYVPDSSLALVAGFAGANGLTGNMRYVSNGSSCSTAACGTYQTIDSHSYLDLSLRKALNTNMDLYVVIENMLDNEDVVARAPKDGIRSQKPRTMKVGFSLNF